MQEVNVKVNHEVTTFVKDKTQGNDADALGANTETAVFDICQVTAEETESRSVAQGIIENNSKVAMSENSFDNNASFDAKKDNILNPSVDKVFNYVNLTRLFVKIFQQFLLIMTSTRTLSLNSMI